MKSPFKFLDSFTKEDRNIFFGRDKEIEELYQKVFESKILLMYGISGTGKSSLIYCGLANKFEENGIINLRWYQNINRDQFKTKINRSISADYLLSLNDLYTKLDGNGTFRVVSEILSMYKTKRMR